MTDGTIVDKDNKKLYYLKHLLVLMPLVEEISLVAQSETVANPSPQLSQIH